MVYLWYYAFDLFEHEHYNRIFSYTDNVHTVRTVCVVVEYRCLFSCLWRRGDTMRNENNVCSCWWRNDSEKCFNFHSKLVMINNRLLPIRIHIEFLRTNIQNKYQSIMNEKYNHFAEFFVADKTTTAAAAAALVVEPFFIDCLFFLFSFTFSPFPLIFFFTPSMKLVHVLCVFVHMCSTS